MKKCKYIKGRIRLIGPVGCIFNSGSPGRLPVYLFTLLAHCLFFTAVASAQSSSATIKASVNRDHVLIGEPVELHIEVKTSPGRPVTKWFNLPDSFNHLEVLSRSPMDSAMEASVTTYRQSFTITGFDSGIWVIPAVKVTINKQTIRADSLPVTIVPVQLKDSTYHDIREIIDVPDEKTPWWYWVAGILSLAVLGILVWLWLKSRTAKPIASGVHSSTLSPLEEAINSLRALEAEQLTNNEEWKKHYSILTGIFKVYIERRFSIPALQKTTDELLLLLNGMLDKQMVSKTAEALRISDAVKFARYQPGKELASASLHTIEKVIRALDHLKQ
ncbi:BatD family protein [Agriterribacter sp.]|uniref:BatD family protein n=1 Tax=Agriterribacter sp. TaxID=2821509 RepID=UPI002B989222|nr:BatD family protein [Agriterribacter sp.]HRO47920.1 BatD family protein [Agriterribacter sp.]HRQ19114.1 BatD family protein [Agriterribacter sp.]